MNIPRIEEPYIVAAKDLRAIERLLLNAPDVRRWDGGDRRDLRSGVLLDLVVKRRDPETKIAHDEWVSCVDRNAVAAVSIECRKQWKKSLGLNRMVIDIGEMSAEFIQPHLMALLLLTKFFRDICMVDDNGNLKVPGEHGFGELRRECFFDDLALRHVCRQLKMVQYVPRRPKTYLMDAHTNALQPWQINELLFACSTRPNVMIPVVRSPRTDPLHIFMVVRMSGMIADATRTLDKKDLEVMLRWLKKKEHMSLKKCLKENGYMDVLLRALDELEDGRNDGFEIMKGEFGCLKGY